jgi:hypothetical protein
MTISLTGALQARMAARTALLSCCAFMAACGSSLIERDVPGTTYGRIEVGTPRIVSRERLVNDRLEQEEFLKKWLDRAEYQSFDANARTDIRSLRLTSAQIGLRKDPGLEGNFLQQERFNEQVRQAASTDRSLADLQKAAVDKVTDKVRKGEMTLADAKAELAGIGVSFPTVPNATNTVTASTTFGFSPTAASSLNSLTLPNPGSITTTDLRGSPIDLFRDQLALREEIRSELIDNALDDTHDLVNNTLVRLNLDAMIFPAYDTSAWAVVTAQIRRTTATYDATGMALALENQIKEELREHAHRILSLPEDYCDRRRDKPVVTLSDRINCITDATVPGESLKAAVRTELYENVQEAERARREQVRSEQRFLSSREILSVRPTASAPAASSTTAAIALAEIGPNIFRVLGTAYRQVFDQRYGCYFVYDNELANPRSATAPHGYQFDARVSVRPRVWSAAPMGSPERAQLVNCGWRDADQANRAMASFWSGQSALADEVVSIYGVMPKETVQRVSEVASRRAATEFALGLNAVAPGGSVGALLNSIRANEAFNQAIRRQPLVVGFTNRGTARYRKEDLALAAGVVPSVATGAVTMTGDVTFGWVMGPHFKIAKDGEAGGYRHKVQQQMLSALLSVPRHWTNAELVITTQWVHENGDPRHVQTMVTPIDLPGRPSGALDVIAQHTRMTKYQPRRPEALAVLSPILIQGEPATIVVEGLNSWRNAELYVGSQKADSIRMLPDMRGIVATFNRIGNLAGAEWNGQGYPVALRTSEGTARVGYAQLKKGSSMDNLVVGYASAPRIAGTSSFTLSTSPPLTGFSKLSVVAKATTSAASETFADVRVSGNNISVNVPGGAIQSFPNGQRVNLLLRLQPTASDVERTFPVNTEPVLYLSDADSKIKVSLAPTLASFPKAMTLTVPLGLREAYPSAQGDLKITFTDEMNPGVAIRSSACVVKADRTCTVTIQAPADYVAKAGKSGATLTLRSPQGWPDLTVTEVVVAEKK